MSIFKLLLAFLWIVWILYWLISAVGAKRSIRGSNWFFEAAFRVAFIVVIVLFLRIPVLYHFVLNATIHSESLYTNPFISILGFLIFLLGFALSIWARFSLGKNWGMPTTLREKPELITTGPYAFIRHPIYTGIILTMLGAMLVISLVWFIPLLAVCVYFIYSLKVEEKDMMKQFPKEYKEYKKKTKALIPFIY